MKDLETFYSALPKETLVYKNAFILGKSLQLIYLASKSFILHKMVYEYIFCFCYCHFC